MARARESSSASGSSSFHVVIEVIHLASQERPLVIHPLDLESPPAHGQNIQPPVRIFAQHPLDSAVQPVLTMPFSFASTTPNSILSRSTSAIISL